MITFLSPHQRDIRRTSLAEMVRDTSVDSGLYGTVRTTRYSSYCISQPVYTRPRLIEMRDVALLNNNNNNNNNNGFFTGSVKRRTIASDDQQISKLLDAKERESVLKHMGDSVLCVNSGVVQLLHASGESWKDAKVGVICYCRDYSMKKVSLRLVDPIEGERARELWRIELPKQFSTTKSYTHLLTFETDTGEVIGLNFSDPNEAIAFQDTVDEQRLRRQKGAIRESLVDMAVDTPVRAAPPPPTMVDNHDRSRTNSITAMGVLPPQTPTKEERKEKKKNFFGTISRKFGKKKKKKLEVLDISNPSDFRHLNHMGLEDLSETDKETVHQLADQLKVDTTNRRDMKILIKNVLGNGDVIRQSMRKSKAPKEQSPPPPPPISSLPPSPVSSAIPADPLATCEAWGDSGNDSFTRTPITQPGNRSPGNRSLTDTRDSIRLHNPTHRKTPYVVKQKSGTPSVGRPRIDESYTPTSSLSSSLSSNRTLSLLEDAPPPPPNRSTSVASRAHAFESRVENRHAAYRLPPPTHEEPVRTTHTSLPTPPESPVPPPPVYHIPQITTTPPKIGHKSSSKPPPTISVHNPRLPQAPPLPSVAPPSMAPPPAPPLPPPGVMSSPPQAPPPPPMTTPPQSINNGTLRPNNLPMPGVERADLLDSIRKASVASLRPVTPNASTPKSPSGGEEGIIGSIQRQLDMRRQAVASDSDSDDSSSNDSDWDED